jgi:hypothetical protein
MHVLNVNFLAIAAAAVAAWIFGAIYYGALGKTWMAALGTSMDAMKAQNARGR